MIIRKYITGSDGLYQLPTLVVNRSRTVVVAPYRLLNITAAAHVALDTTGLTSGYLLTVYATSGTPVSVSWGQQTVGIPYGKKLFLSWTGSNFNAELVSLAQ